MVIKYNMKYKYLINTIGAAVPREREELSSIPKAGFRTRLRNDVTDEELQTAVLKEFLPYLSEDRRRYLREEGFID